MRHGLLNWLSDYSIYSHTKYFHLVATMRRKELIDKITIEGIEYTELVEIKRKIIQ